MSGPRMSRPRSAANYGPERGTTYLLHFDRPYRHARHYTGWTTDLKGRLDAHRRGDGSKFMRYIRAAGIGFTLARTWPGTTKDREDSIKHQGGASRFCPECGAVPGTPRLASDTAAARADRRPMWQADRDGQWADGTPIIYDPDLTWQQARADRAAVQIPEPDPASREELAALDELERRWTQQEEPMFGSKARAERRSQAEADRLFALAEELEKQALPRPNYAREITAERAARMRERLGEDLVQDAQAQTSGPGLQGAELDAEIERLARQYPEPTMTFGEEVRLTQGPEAWEALKQQYQRETGAPDPDRDVTAGASRASADRGGPGLGPEVERMDERPAEAPGADDSEPVFGPRPDGTYASAIDSDIAARAGEAEQLAAPQPDLSAEEIQAFEQAERERWAQVDRDTEYMARRAAQYYGPEIADLLGIEPGDAVQAPDSPGPHRDVAGYEAGAPDHFYGSPECAEADPETAHFGNGPGDPEDHGSSPQPGHRQAGPSYGGFACENFAETREGVRQADAADALRLGQTGGWPAIYGAYGAQPQLEAG
jgi:predicted GIY-YIG superfamily endonuclease